MPHSEIPADVVHAARQTPRAWEVLPVLSEWYLDARTGRVEIEVPPAEEAPGPVGDMPELVLFCLARVPALWPITLELARWLKDGRTGRIEVELVDGASRELRRVEQVGLVRRSERLVLGRGLNLPEGAVPACPTCRGHLHDQDYGNRWFCAGCDRLWTVWELKRQNAFRAGGDA